MFSLSEMALTLNSCVEIPTLLIQSSNYVVDVVREEPSAVQDSGQHGCNGSTGHRLIV